MTDIHLGYAVPEGGEVRIPLNHTVITGQTQMAGKTTALEALLSRAPGRSAIAFMTKRGEGAFFGAHVIPPFFQEQADWRYVAAILEASRGEKMRMERAWIIRASKGAHSLADVQRNVRDLMAKSRPGFQQDMYLVLDAYLEIVVPQISAVRWARTVELEHGLNVMDLSLLADEMQHLVIRSTIEWVLKHGNCVTVVVPEAWKFLPQGRGTPVKLAAEAYIRQGAALANYLWLDSQDIAGVEKLILKSCPIWLLGVQRESNEIKRTLAQIPASVKKPKPDEIATLELGQFYVCYGKHTTKTYVRPVWMLENDARAIAVGAMAVGDSRKPGTVRRTLTKEVMDVVAPKQGAYIAAMGNPHPLSWVEEQFIQGEADVKESEAKALQEENERLQREVDSLRDRLEAVLTGSTPQAQREARLEIQDEVPSRKDVTADLLNGNFDTFYAAIRDRLAKEAPKLLKLAGIRPEIDMEVTVETIKVDGKSLRGRVVQLLANGFFDEGCLQSHVRTELERRGAGVSDAKNLPREIAALVEMGFLTIEDGKDANGRERKMYVAVPGMKVNIR